MPYCAFRAKKAWDWKKLVNATHWPLELGVKKTNKRFIYSASGNKTVNTEMYSTWQEYPGQLQISVGMT